MQKIKVGIIGAGRIGQVHAKSITYHIPQAQLVAISDIYEEGAKKVAEELGIPNYYKDYHEILNDPSIDAVLICSSTDTHADIACEAAAAGKHIFCEKPVDLTVAKIKKVIEAVDKAGVKLQIGFNRRYDHNFAYIKQLEKDGKIGRIQTVKITSRDPEPPTIDYVKVSGGIFLDMTVHDFDMARFLFGEPEKVSAIARDGITPQQWSDSRLFFPDGLVVSVNASWNESASFPFTCTFRLTAEHATVLWDGQHPLRVFPDAGEPYTLSYPARDYMAEEIRFLATCILKNCQNHKNPPSSARNTVLLANTLRESAARGGEVLRFSPD